MGTNNHIAQLKSRLDQAIIQRDHWKQVAENRNSIVVTEVCPESRSVEEYIIDADSVRASWRLMREYREQSEALRAELEAARKQEPVASVVSCYVPSGKRVALNTEYQDLPVGTQLYAYPPASPDVEGLVKALEATLRLDRGTSGRIILEADDEEVLRTALSTWRQAQEGKP